MLAKLLVIFAVVATSVVVFAQSLGTTYGDAFYLLARGTPPHGNFTEKYVTIAKPTSGNSYESHGLSIRQDSVSACSNVTHPPDIIPVFHLVDGMLHYSLNVTTADKYTITLEYSNAHLHDNESVSFTSGCGGGRQGLVNLETGSAKFLSVGGTSGADSWMACDEGSGMIKLGLKVANGVDPDKCYRVYLLATTKGP